MASTSTSTEAANVGGRKSLHTVIPPLILGTGTFNTQFVEDPFNEADLPARSLVARALDLGINGFDTSPYYGPSEIILGDALSQPAVTEKYPRSSYFLETKVGRVAVDAFDYTPSWVRYSVYRSLERLKTPYLDLVYAHDVEFVSLDEVLAAVGELRRLRDEGLVRYVGISAFPLGVLCTLAEKVLESTGEPLDAILSYGHYNIQNTLLDIVALDRFNRAGVDVVMNASFLCMGLLTTKGVDTGPLAAWHMSPEGLRTACRSLVPITTEAGESLENVAIRWALDSWARHGASTGSLSKRLPGRRVGASIAGVVNLAELEGTARVWESVLDGLAAEDSSTPAEKRSESLKRYEKIQDIVKKMQARLGAWKDTSWSSPNPGWVNNRSPAEKGKIPDDGIFAKYAEKKH